MTTFAAAAQRLASPADAVGTDAQANADVMLRRREITLRKVAADAMASTTTAALADANLAAYVPDAMTVEAIRVEPLGGTLTADNTDYVTFTITHYTTVAGGQTTIKAFTTETTGTGSWVAGTTLVIPLTAAVNIPAGNKVTMAIAKAGAGKAVPVSSYHIIGRLT